MPRELMAVAHSTAVERRASVLLPMELLERRVCVCVFVCVYVCVRADGNPPSTSAQGAQPRERDMNSKARPPLAQRRAGLR